MSAIAKTITIRGKKYPQPHIDRMKRKQAKALKPILANVKDDDLDALWEVVGLLLPTIPKNTLDDLGIGECKQIMTAAGVATFKVGEDDDKDDSEESNITVGEFGASTDS